MSDDSLADRMKEYNDQVFWPFVSSKTWDEISGFVDEVRALELRSQGWAAQAGKLTRENEDLQQKCRELEECWQAACEHCAVIAETTKQEPKEWISNTIAKAIREQK